MKSRNILKKIQIQICWNEKSENWNQPQRLNFSLRLKHESLCSAFLHDGHSYSHFIILEDNGAHWKVSKAVKIMHFLQTVKISHTHSAHGCWNGNVLRFVQMLYLYLSISGAFVILNECYIIISSTFLYKSRMKR